MTDEQINITIAEACGWKNITRSTSSGWLHKRLIGTNEKMRVTFDVHTPIPNYCNDLNAMHEAEMKLTKEQSDDYVARLFDSCYELAFATASQRAEAFLRTLGKWDHQSVGRTEMVKEAQK